MSATRLCVGFVLAVLAPGLGACRAPLDPLGQPPLLTPIGTGLSPPREALPTTFGSLSRRTYHSTWSPSGVDLFQDPRARSVGDVITVSILIDDKAQFGNSSDRSRSQKSSLGFDFGYGVSGMKDAATADAGIRSGTETKGAGNIDRSEVLRLSVAAIVTEQMPNGNMVVSGSQEVRVNNEVRVLNVAGIVRPRDISRKNTIDYDKIAEARISYGGRGRITDVQGPTVGQQIFETLAPF
ncbi:MAG: flagellar basal body L-ring protein FlgH [Methylobacterium sp.]|jgi:flagellar L-ring protein precursor FlgH|uniref:flagellar basal body L-ring protein FlgH n=1 Tax=unclassified Methylobacterium TaxID=2615210 RepID=UPI0006F8CC52|nr:MULTISPECIES: flagellar basal body L-ring protein FlgH [unclassified Methylobacterium]KQP10208.1 flagellar biosynthesis protein FlgH [Methylobacterium sp. Leaf99]MDO9426189.1 flagellar basal body L-ring protein FlgH [Methylobacterium sp.]